MRETEDSTIVAKATSVPDHIRRIIGISHKTKAGDISRTVTVVITAEALAIRAMVADLDINRIISREAGEIKVAIVAKVPAIWAVAMARPASIGTIRTRTAEASRGIRMREAVAPVAIGHKAVAPDIGNRFGQYFRQNEI